MSRELGAAMEELIAAYPTLVRTLAEKDPARRVLDRALNAWSVEGEDAPAATPADWLLDAAALLSEPDPGPTPWLVEGLIVDQALAAVVGKWKTTKSWGMLDIALSIATGTAAFGAAHVPEPGPVVYVIEESGKRALWRRLDALCRGRGIRPEDLAGQLFLAPNARVKLDNEAWQQTLLELGTRIRPRAFIFDPLARMKDAGREENEQTGMAPLIEYLRVLRDDTGAAAIFVHHTGHSGEHMRGSSDLESAWESRLAFKRDGDNGIVTVTAAHREEEDGATVIYQLDWHSETRTMRLRPTVPPLAERIIDHLRDHGPMGATELRKASKQDAQMSTARWACSRRLGRPAAARPESRTPWDDPARTRCGISVTKRHCGSSRSPDGTGRPTCPRARPARLVPPL